MGLIGQSYVREQFTNREAFIQRIESALKEPRRPLAERLRRRGLERAADFDRSRWHEEYGRIVEEVLHAPPRMAVERVEVEPRSNRHTVAAGAERTLIAVR